MERLTERFGHVTRFKKTADGKPLDMNIIIGRLAAYEDAEEQGLLLRLPCKVGDTIYHTVGDDAGNGKEYLLKRHVEPIKFNIYMLDNDGKLKNCYFLTREDAERAFAEGKP